jgi:hypothetical protein
MNRDEAALAILCAMVGSPPEGIDRTKVNKLVWARAAYEFADALKKASNEPKNKLGS